MSEQFPPERQPERPPWRPPPRQEQPGPLDEPRPDTGIRDIDPLFPPDSLLYDHGARVLDPVTAVRPRGDSRRLRPTVYVGNALLVPAELVERLGTPLADAAKLYGMQPVLDERDLRRAQLLARADTDTPFAVRIWLQPLGAPVDVDAWPVLQALRGAAPPDLARDLTRVGLEHLLGGGWPAMQGTPVMPGTSAAVGGPTTEYGQIGRGGRAPVSYVGNEPHRDDRPPTRRPVVAVLDTGAGAHSWFDGVVTRGVDLGGEPAGLPASVPDPEIRGDIVGPLDGVLDTHSGHGTFICGLIRQLCPDADVLAIRVMYSDGIVEESDLNWALAVLDARLARLQAGNARDGQLDVVVLSLGYYHESPLLPRDDSVLRSLLASLPVDASAVAARYHPYSSARASGRCLRGRGRRQRRDVAAVLPRGVHPAPRRPGGQPSQQRGAAGQRRQPEPGHIGRAVLQQRRLGDSVGYRRRRGEYLPHDVRRWRGRIGADRRPQWPAAPHHRPGLLHQRLRHLERHVVRRAGAGRPAGAGPSRRR